jgi:hypothetical protein
MKLQELASDADLRIKFASPKEDDTYVYDASEEYNCLFAEMPESWESTVVEEGVPRRLKGTRRA